MGVYYHYINHSKKERFAVDALGGGVKRSALSRTLAARAFHLMLTGETGRWAGDNIAILGDDIAPNWDAIVAEYADITANAILTLFASDGFAEISERAAQDDLLLLQLCYMVTAGQAPDLEFEVTRLCDGSCHKRFAQLSKQHPHFVGKNVVL